MDHSPRFWALLERHLPGYREPRAGCARNGAALVAVSAPRPRVGVVGHVEWVEFAVVDRLPAPGEIVHARETLRARRPAAARSRPCRWRGSPARRCSSPRWATTSSAAPPTRSCARAASRSTPRGAATRARGAAAPTSTDDGERTITILGPRIVPHGDDDAAVGAAAPSSTASTSPAATPRRPRARRAARVLVATPRAADALREAGVELDVLVASASRPGRGARPRDARPAPRDRRPHRGRRRRQLGGARRRRRALGRRAAAGADRRRLRLRRHVRRRPDLRPRRPAAPLDDALALAPAAARSA